MTWQEAFGESPHLSTLPPIVVDIETVGTPFDGRVLSVSWQTVDDPEPHVALYEDVPADAWAMMADPSRPFVSHTIYDARFLRLVGRTVTGPYHDTKVMAWVIDENQPLKLDEVVRVYTGETMDKRVRRSEGRAKFQQDDGTYVEMDQAPVDQLLAYNARDVASTARLYQELWGLLEVGDWLDYWLCEEVPFTEVLVDMECRGLCIDVAATERLRDELEVEDAQLRAELLDDGGLPPGFNLDSDKQLSQFLYQAEAATPASIPCTPGEYNGLGADEALEMAQFVMDEIVGSWPATLLDQLAGTPSIRFKVEKVGRTYIHGQWQFQGLGLPVAVYTESGAPSVSRSAIIMWRQLPWVEKFLVYSKVDKLLTTYLRKFPAIAVNGRIYGRFNQTGTKTGRLSSSEPNLQNIPQRGKYGPRVRGLFKP